MKSINPYPTTSIRSLRINLPPYNDNVTCNMQHAFID